MKPCIVVLMVISTIVLCGAASAAEDQDPVIGGKKLSKLLKDIQSMNRGIQVRAARKLGEAPPETAEAVIPKLIPLLKVERRNVHAWVAQALGNFGAKSRGAVPDLLPLLEGTQFERNRAAAAKALGQILKDAKPSEEVEKVTKALVAGFNDQYSDVQREAVRACGMIGPAAKSCIPHLGGKLKGFTGGNWNRDAATLVREQAAYACMRMGELAKEHIDLLIVKLHQEGQKSPLFVKAIGAIGPVHENVVPNIVDKLEVPDPAMWYQIEAYEVLEKFGPKAAPAASLLDRYLRESKMNGKGTIQIIKTLKAIGPAAKQYIPTLEKFKTAKKYSQRHGGAATPEEMAEMNKLAGEAIETIKKEEKKK